MHVSGDGIVVEHMEMVTTVVSSGYVDGGTTGNFLTNTIMLAPGLSETSPWLQQLANAYEVYRYHFVTVEYVPALPTGQGGQIRLAIDPDCEDAAPTALAEMMSFKFRTETSCWDRCRVNLTGKADPTEHRWRYITDVNPPKTVTGQYASQDYFSGRVFVSVSGVPANAVCGQIFLRYRVQFKTPSPRGNAIYSGLEATNKDGVTNTTSALKTVQSIKGMQRLSETLLQIDEIGEYIYDHTAGGCPTAPGTPPTPTITSGAATFVTADVPNFSIADGTSWGLMRVLKVTGAPCILSYAMTAAQAGYAILRILKQPDFFKPLYIDFNTSRYGVVNYTPAYLEAAQAAGYRPKYQPSSCAFSFTPRLVTRPQLVGEDVVTDRLADSDSEYEVMSVKSVKKRK
jgi:hypothetical protein